MPENQPWVAQPGFVGGEDDPGPKSLTANLEGVEQGLPGLLELAAQGIHAAGDESAVIHAHKLACFEVENQRRIQP